MNTTFISASLLHMDARLVKACALWAALRIAEHETPKESIVAGLVFAVDDFRRDAAPCGVSAVAAYSRDCPSAIRSAIFGLMSENFRLHAEHALVELAKQQGVHFVNAMLNDLHESNTSPLEGVA